MNWLGTDDQGRDVLARIIYGFRLSVLFALALTFFSASIGIFAGAAQGYFGGWVDLLFQRLIEIWQGLPGLYILIIISSILVPSVGVVLFILVLFISFVVCSVGVRFGRECYFLSIMLLWSVLYYTAGRFGSLVWVVI